jgi:cobalt transporter subunit CbtA
VGTVQTGVQRWQAAPLILAAEVYEDQKAEVPGTLVPVAPAATLSVQTVTAHAHAPGFGAHDHPKVAVQQKAQVVDPNLDPDRNRITAKVWEPDNGAERIVWTWVANALHAFSMALLVFAVMGMWRYRRGTALTAMQLSGCVAAAGWLSFYLWPTLGLPAEVPGMDAAPLHDRQLWWVLAAGCAGVACALAAFSNKSWRWPAAVVLLGLPFALGAPHLQGDALAGFSPTAHAALGQLAQKFGWATTWVALSFWGSMGLVCGIAFQRWLQPGLVAAFTVDRLNTA